MVSIIVPIYNVEKYVKKCLISLVNQTYKNIKIYAVIDGSPDNSAEIVKSFAEKDKRIIVIEKENGGYGSVLQCAIEKIKTKYFAICDPDDWLETNAIEVLINTANKYNLDIVIGDKYNIYENSLSREPIASNLNHEYVKANYIYRGDEVSILAMLSPSPHSKLYRTELAKKIKFPKKTNYTDFLLYMITLDNAESGMYINIPLSNYLHDRIGNSTTDKTIKNIKNQIIVFKEVCKQINSKRNNKYIYYKLYEQYRYLYTYIISQTKKINMKEIKEDLNCIELLKNQRKKIKECLKETKAGIINYMIMKLLFNKKTRFIMYKILIKRAEKNGRND